MMNKPFTFLLILMTMCHISSTYGKPTGGQGIDGTVIDDLGCDRQHGITGSVFQKRSYRDVLVNGAGPAIATTESFTNADLWGLDESVTPAYVFLQNVSQLQQLVQKHPMTQGYYDWRLLNAHRQQNIHICARGIRRALGAFTAAWSRKNRFIHAVYEEACGRLETPTGSHKHLSCIAYPETDEPVVTLSDRIVYSLVALSHIAMTETDPERRAWRMEHWYEHGDSLMRQWEAGSAYHPQTPEDMPTPIYGFSFSSRGEMGFHPIPASYAAALWPSW